ncbi:hypothetical protein [Vibrio crassostreae]|jgi:hypothetical protein|uniref:hypothetical protein n=1 Tax=Vibrio crassostreae TaxID=246167 RepID=UPI001B317A94|nr:hypothetical protein [Vibrio crassostreae]
MKENHLLKIFYKTSNGAGIELASLNDAGHMKSIAQWLLVKRDRSKTSFFVALCDLEGECIDAKYVSDVTVARLLEDWGVPLLVAD